MNHRRRRQQRPMISGYAIHSVYALIKMTHGHSQHPTG